jgi:peptidyl-prolyl cis-trans isomerase B (cyclophilin B)
VPTNQQRRTAAKRKLERQLVNRAERARKRRNLGVIVTVAAVVVVVGGIYLLVNLSSGDDTAAAPSTPPSSTAAPKPDKPATIPTKLAAEPKRPKALAANVSCEYKQGDGASAAKPATAPNGKNVSTTGKTSATMTTSIGEIKMSLNRALAPCAVNSFLSLAKQGYFDNSPCHRMTTGPGLQVLQCGDPTGQGTGGPGYTFKDETFKQLKYGPGILAMANSGANTNGSQFFIVYGDGSGLQPNYSVFGTVDAASLKLIDAVANQGVNPTNGPGDGAPLTPVTITGVTAAN